MATVKREKMVDEDDMGDVDEVVLRSILSGRRERGLRGKRKIVVGGSGWVLRW